MSFWTALGKRTDLPTYVGGWLASLSWLAVVGSTVGDLPFNLLIFALTTIGFAVSFWLRGYVDTPQWPSLQAAVLTPSTFLRVIFMVGGVVPGLFSRQPFAALVPDVAVGTPEWLIGTGFMWAMALYSFGLVTDGLVAFTAVLGVSMLGLMASNNINPEVGIAFLSFLLGVVLMLSNMTLAHHTHHRKDGRSARALSRWFGDQLIVAGLTVATTAFLAIGLAALLQRYSGPGLLPRVNLPGVGGGGGSAASNYAAFDEQMVVGVGGGPNSQDPVLVARAPEPQLWRRRTYDKFNGRVWSRLGTEQTEVSVSPDGHAVIESNLILARELLAVREVESELRYVSAGDFVAPPLVTELTLSAQAGSTGRIDVDRYGNVVDLPMPALGVANVVSAVPHPTPEELRAVLPVNPGGWQGLLRIPASSRPSVGEAARQATAGKTNPYDQAVAIQHWLETEFTYDLLAKIPGRSEDSMHWFLLNRRGACDLIATAMALMARSVGIPARVAVGYGNGEPRADGSYVLRVSDAHAWAELYFEGYDWLPFNPRVPGQDADTAAEEQAAAGGAWQMSRRSAGLLAVLGMTLWLLHYLYRTWRLAQPQFAATPAGRIDAAYHRTQRLLARRGLPRRASETARQYLTRLRREAAEASWLPPLEQLTSLYERSRYELGEVGGPEQAKAEAAAGSIRAALGRKLNRPASGPEKPPHNEAR